MTLELAHFPVTDGCYNVLQLECNGVPIDVFGEDRGGNLLYAFLTERGIPWSHTVKGTAQRNIPAPDGPGYSLLGAGKVSLVDKRFHLPTEDSWDYQDRPVNAERRTLLAVTLRELRADLTLLD
jgi:hypothetical protein